MAQARWIKVAHIADFETTDRKVVNAGDRPVLILTHAGRFFAVDNRCPHMGFPLDKGSVHACILTCHWHDARFDLHSGGTFDQFADDVRAFPVEVRDGAVWLDIAPRTDERAHQRERLRDGLERNIRLVTAKAVIALAEYDDGTLEAFRCGLDFGAHHRAMGWGQGLTMLTCLVNLLPHLDHVDRPRALYHGLDAVAVETGGQPPRFTLAPLPGTVPDLTTLKDWFRQFLQVRDAEGAERCLVTAVRAGATSSQLAAMLFTAITDHRYIDVGHPADFANKALEALDIAGWHLAEPVLASLVGGIARATRMEEANAWRHPIDLVALLEQAFAELPRAVAAGHAVREAGPGMMWTGSAALAERILSDNPAANLDTLIAALRDGATPVQVAGAVTYAAALRVARFHTSNEFFDWDATLHTFSFANAMHQALRRVSGSATESSGAADDEVALLRGVLDAAMSVYLTRFLNMPAARLPQPRTAGSPPEAILDELLPLLDRQQQVNPAGEVVASYLARGGDKQMLLATLGKALLREDRDFHTIQMVEAAIRQYDLLRGSSEGTHILVAAARYLAAHAPTVREQGQTFGIADRLHRGEKLYAEEETV